MSSHTTRIAEVRFDAAAQRYHAAVTHYETSGPRVFYISTSGHPAWNHQQTVAALLNKSRNAANPGPRWPRPC